MDFILFVEVGFKIYNINVGNMLSRKDIIVLRFNISVIEEEKEVFKRFLDEGIEIIIIMMFDDKKIYFVDIL